MFKICKFNYKVSELSFWKVRFGRSFRGDDFFSFKKNVAAQQILPADVCSICFTRLSRSIKVDLSSFNSKFAGGTAGVSLLDKLELDLRSLSGPEIEESRIIFELVWATSSHL